MYRSQVHFRDSRARNLGDCLTNHSLMLKALLANENLRAIEDRSSTRGLACAMETSMVRQLTIVVTLSLALWSAAMPVSARGCAMSMPAGQGGMCTDCCATMKSCVLPQQNRVPPASASSGNQQSITLITQPIASVVVQAAIALPRINFSGTEISADSPPRLAVLCTFLI